MNGVKDFRQIVDLEKHSGSHTLFPLPPPPPQISLLENSPLNDCLCCSSIHLLRHGKLLVRW